MHKQFFRRPQAIPLRGTQTTPARESSQTFLARIWYFSGGARTCSTASPVELVASEDAVHVVKKRRTRKAFSELPKTFTAADGTPASPLGPWRGGLTSESVSKPVIDSVGVFISHIPFSINSPFAQCWIRRVPKIPTSSLSQKEGNGKRRILQ